MIEPITSAQMQRDYEKMAIAFGGTIGDLAKVYAKRVGIKPETLMNRRRFKRIAHPRQDFWTYLHREIGYPQGEIARSLGWDRTTVYHGISASMARQSQEAAQCSY